MSGSGYLSRQYGRSFRHIGDVLSLPKSQAQLIKRPINCEHFDVTGLFPYAMCDDWSKLDYDLDYLRDLGAVSVVFVVDPFAWNVAGRALRRWAVCRPFKTQLLVDLSKNWRGRMSRSLRRSISRGLNVQSARGVPSDGSYAHDLWSLYQNTITRHQVSGTSRLSKLIIREHLEAPGAKLIVAHDSSGLSGAAIFFGHGQTANCHLLFLSSRAHQNATSYALYYTGLKTLEAAGCRVVNLGGVAGYHDDSENGLFKYKQKWANARAKTLLCGEILDMKAYEQLQWASGAERTDYFPAYRSVAAVDKGKAD